SKPSSGLARLPMGCPVRRGPTMSLLLRAAITKGVAVRTAADAPAGIVRPAASFWEPTMQPLPFRDPVVDLRERVAALQRELVGDRGPVLTSRSAWPFRDTFREWTAEASGTTENLLAIAGDDRTLVLAGEHGTLLRGTPSGFAPWSEE